MSEENSESKSKIKVNDKRRIDKEGKQKENTESVAKENEQSFTVSESADSAGGEDTEVTFASLVASLATQALIHMGEIPAPDGIDAKVDKNAAKQTIDLLSVLQEKTKGNLDNQENYFLEEMLHNLRISFLKLS